VSKKTRKSIKPRKPEKKQPKKSNRKKNPIKPITFLKKPAGSVWFRFYKQKTEKTEPNRTETDKKPEKKPSQTEKTEPNQFEPVFALKKPNRTETGQFDPVSVRFRFFFKKKNFNLVTFFDKNRTKPKMITPSLVFYS